MTHAIDRQGDAHFLRIVDLDVTLERRRRRGRIGGHEKARTHRDAGCTGSERVDGRNDTTVNIEVDSIEEAERVFAALSAGGQVQMPLMETEWARRFGMFEDRFGKPWMINCMQPAR